MDVSYDEKDVDYVVADLNRMTQGIFGSFLIQVCTDTRSIGKSHHQCHQVHREEGGRKDDNCLHGRLQRAPNVLPAERDLFRPRGEGFPHGLDNVIRLGRWICILPDGCSQGYRYWHQRPRPGEAI